MRGTEAPSAGLLPAADDDPQGVGAAWAPLPPAPLLPASSLVYLQRTEQRGTAVRLSWSKGGLTPPTPRLDTGQVVQREAMTKAKCNYPNCNLALLPAKHVIFPFGSPFTKGKGVAFLRTAGSTYKPQVPNASE